MRKIVAAIAIVFAFFALATGAEARTHHPHYRHSTYHHSAYHHYRHHADHHIRYSFHRRYRQEYATSSFGFELRPSRYERAGRAYSSYRHAHVAGRPAAWCGWYMRQQVGADPGPEYNLARSWAHYGSNAGGPAVGTIVVWRHHVGKIVGQVNGQWIVESGNDGHAVRARPRSLAGAIAFRRAYASM